MLKEFIKKYFNPIRDLSILALLGSIDLVHISSIFVPPAPRSSRKQSELDQSKLQTGTAAFVLTVSYKISGTLTNPDAETKLIGLPADALLVLFLSATFSKDFRLS